MGKPLVYDWIALDELGMLQSLRRGENITPDDGAAGETSFVSRQIIPDTDGTITVDIVDGGTQVAIPCLAGIPITVSVTKIYATGTNSTTVFVGQ